MKLVLAMMRHETNTLSPLATPLAAFGPKSGDRAMEFYRGTNNPIAAYADIAEREGAEYVVPLRARRCRAPLVVLVPRRNTLRPESLR